MFSLAHLSDLHLGPLPGGGIGDYFGKRFIGLMSWTFRRRRIHDPQVAQALLADIAAHRPDHIAFTGDLVNISLPAEFTRGAAYLRAIAPADRLTFVPGNHDAYVPFPWRDGLERWAPYMAGDMRLPGGRNGQRFPFVRQRRNVALVGLSSAVPQPPRKAGGTLGRQQLDDLERALKHLGSRGYFRIVLIHHPPLPDQAIPRKALTDAADLSDVLAKGGAELVLHGHNHRRMAAMLGGAHIDGVPSASGNGARETEPAGWTLYRIQRRGAAWQVEKTMRNWDPRRRVFETAMESPAPPG